MSEQTVFGCSSINAFNFGDNQQWTPLGVCNLAIIQTPNEITILVTNQESKQVVISTVVTPQLVHRKDGELFQQWRSNRIYGVRFQNLTESLAFDSALDTAVALSVKRENKGSQTLLKPSTSDSTWPTAPFESPRSPVRKGTFNLGHYRVNNESKEEFPSSSSLSSDEKTVKPSEPITKPEEKVSDVSLSDSEGEWKEAVASDGRVYFYNTITRQTSWNRPGEAITRRRSIDAAPEPEVRPRKRSATADSPLKPSETLLSEVKKEEQQKDSIKLLKPIQI